MNLKKKNQIMIAAVTVVLLFTTLFPGCKRMFLRPAETSEATAVRETEYSKTEAGSTARTTVPPETAATETRQYVPSVSWAMIQAVPNVPTDEATCSVMQGMCCDERYAYTVKVSEDDACAAFSRVDLDTGELTVLPYYESLSAVAPTPCRIMGHANDMTAVKIDGETHIFVASPKESFSLVRLLVRNDSIYLVGVYALKRVNGDVLKISAVDHVRTENGTVFLLGKTSLYYYSCPVTAAFSPDVSTETPTEITCPRLFIIDIRNAQFVDTNGKAYRIENAEAWANQGSAFDTENGMLYVPVWKRSTNENAIIVFDVSSAVTTELLLSGKNRNTVFFPCEVSVHLRHTQFRMFEMESCDFRMEPDGTGYRLLYFNNNATAQSEGVYVTSIYSGMLPKSTIVSEDTVVYSVKYDANGGENKMDTTRHIADVPTNLRPLAFTREGYAFTGWRLERRSDGTWLCWLSDGNVGWFTKDTIPEDADYALLADQVCVFALSTVPNDVITAYAQWEAAPPEEGESTSLPRSGGKN